MANPSFQLAMSAILAMIPVIGWGYIFFKKNPEDRYISTVLFLAGGLSVFPILLYKYSWQFFPWMNAFNYADKFADVNLSLGALLVVPMSVIVTFMIVGIIEEWVKHITVRISADKYIGSIDDAIMFSIIAALGFAFTENILYFYDIWLTHGAQNLILPFIFRSLFSTFAHVMFSGIFGYFYGIAHFADPILQAEMKTKRKTATKLMHKILRFRKDHSFHHEKILEGLLISAVLHAIFNIALEMNMPAVIVPFLGMGYFALDFLIKQKENHKKYNRLVESGYSEI